METIYEFIWINLIHTCVYWRCFGHEDDVTLNTFAETQEVGEEPEVDSGDEAASDDEEDDEDAADAKEAEEGEEDDGEWKLARGTSPGQGAEDRIYPGTFNPETPKPQKLKLIL